MVNKVYLSHRAGSCHEQATKALTIESHQIVAYKYQFVLFCWPFFFQEYVWSILNSPKLVEILFPEMINIFRV